MNQFLDKLEDRILNGVLWLLEPFMKDKTEDNSVYLYFDLGLSIIIGSIIAAGSMAYSSSRQRSAQKKMAKKQMAQQAKETKMLAEAEKSTRTPQAPKNQQLTIQATPKSAKRTSSSLAIGSRKGGKGSLRTGTAGNYGARVA